MTYRTIVTHLATPERVPSIIKLALPVAEKFDAHLIGMHVTVGISVAGTIGAQVPGEIIEQYREMLREDAKATRKAFNAATKGSDVKTEWYDQEEKTARIDLLAAITGRTLCSDLVVMGQGDGPDRRGELSAEVVMSTGRPVILVPREGEFGAVGQRVTVAWNASREAARAAFDALPFLQKAKSVSVLSIHDGHAGNGDACATAEDFALVLARHGVSAEAVDVNEGNLSTSERLLAYASETKCDLLVMGCYGHSRLRERIFGGVTRYMLRNMTVPVLMSH